MKLGIAAPITMAWIIAVASSTLYLNKFIKMTTLNIPIAFPDKLHNPQEIGMIKYTKAG